MATPSQQIRDAWAVQDRALEAIYTVIPVGQEQRHSGRNTWAALTDITPHQMGAFADVLAEAGILGRRVQWGTKAGETGKEALWTLLVTHDEAKRLLAAYREQTPTARKRGPRRGRKAKAEAVVAESVLVASTGPEPATPLAVGLQSVRTKDEPAALVAAAKQYRDRRALLESHLKQLAQAGITHRLDITESFDFAIDEQLEVIVRALPYIENLERNLEHWTNHSANQKREIRELRAELELLKRRTNGSHRPVEPTVVHGD